MSVFSEGEGVSVAPSRRRQRFHRRRNRQTLRTKLVRRVAQAEPAVAAFAATRHAAVVVENEGAVLAGLHLVQKRIILMINARTHPIEISCKIFEHFALQVDSVIEFKQLGSTPFKDSAILALKLADPPFWWKNNSTPSKSGSGLPDPEQLIFCTIYRCLLDEIYLLRNQISPCQLYYTGGLFHNCTLFAPMY